MVSAAIYGCAGLTLSPDESAFFRDADPWGFILFRRNVETAEQTRALIASLREAVGRDAPVLVDHEGGRVSRLSPHIVPKRPAMAVLDQLAQASGLEAAVDAAHLAGEILGRDASALGFDVNCVPMVDVKAPDADDIIGDRALGVGPEQVIALGRALAAGSAQGGCLPVVKHIPGHGRATCDSHLELPRVGVSEEALSECDFAPFAALSDLPLGMTAHIIYDAIDPDQPATLSKRVIEDIIRTKIGFDGLLMTDDLSMKALTGRYDTRAAASLAAGCDLVLHCNGDSEEMLAVAKGTGLLSTEAARRSEAALAKRQAPSDVPMSELEHRFASLTNAATFRG